MKVPNMVIMSLEEYSLERVKTKDLEQENNELKETVGELVLKYQKLCNKFAVRVGREAWHLLKLSSDIEVDVEKQTVNNDWLDEQIKKEFKDIPEDYLPIAWRELKKYYDENKV